MVKQSMARYVTARDKHIRPRWKAYLGARLRRRSKSESQLPSVEQLDVRLREARKRERGAALIYSYLHGLRTPTPSNVFAIGEAFYRCGLSWENGPTALYAAGHDAPLIAFMAHLAESGEAGVRCALDLHAALPLAVEPEINAALENISLENELLYHKVADGKELGLDEARKYIAESIASAGADLLNAAWLKVCRDNDISAHPMRGVRSEAARLAYRNASSSLAPYLARDAAWRILDEWTGEFQESWPPLKRRTFRNEYESWRTVTQTHTQKVGEQRQPQLARTRKRNVQ